MSDEMRKKFQQRIGICAGLGGAVWGVVHAMWVTDAITTPVFGMLMIIPTVLFFILIRNVMLLGQSGTVARPIWRYNRDFLASIALYIVGLMTALWLWNSVEGARSFAWILALLPILPTFAMIYVMGRYLTEETDEYQRHRVVMASIFGLGFVLVIGTFWGFMETFGVVPHIWAWWVVPAWAIGLGIGQGWLAMREAPMPEDDV